MRGGRRRRHRSGRPRDRADGLDPRASPRSLDLERYRPYVPDWSDFLEIVARPEPTVFRVRTGRIAPDRLAARLEARGFRLRPLEGLPTFFRVEDGPHPISMSVEHWLGLLYVQQASTGVAAPVVGAAPGMRVLDLCAAPGGKTAHLAELMKDRGCLVASEISEARVRGLLGNLHRLCCTNVLVIGGDGRAFPEGALFDRVLVDAPCSGEGTLRRRSGQVPDQSPRFRAFVTDTQRSLLERAVRLTRPGGLITYVTCSFAPEENEAVVSHALERLPVEIEPIELSVPHAHGLTRFESLRFDPRVEATARIYPHHLDSGGLFMARFRRLDGALPATPSSGPGWSVVPAAFPDVDAPRAAAAALEDVGERDEHAWARIRSAIDTLCLSHDPGRDLNEVGWTMRGGRAWLHTVGEWPLESWTPGRWRAISLGLRAIEFDSAGRPRPTNDLLRWAGVRSGVVDLERTDLDALLAGASIPWDSERRGPVALGLDGEVLGRGAATASGLRQEIPKARAAELRRVLEVEGASGANPAGPAPEEAAEDAGEPAD